MCACRSAWRWHLTPREHCSSLFSNLANLYSLHSHFVSIRGLEG